MSVLTQITEPARWRAQVADAQAAWARNQALADESASVTRQAVIPAEDTAGESRLRAVLAPWGAPVDSLLPFWKSVAADSGLTLSDLADGTQSYFTNITNPAGNANWWGANAWARVPLQGAGLARPSWNWSKYLDPASEAQQQKALGEQLMAQQKKSGGGFFEDLLPLVAIAGIVTGGLGLIGALGEAAATTAAGWVSAEGGAGYAAGLAADSVAASSLSLSAMPGIAKNAYSVASGLNKLTADQPTTSPGATRMANSSPLDIFYSSSGTTQATAETRQAAVPTVPGTSGGPPPNAGIFGAVPPGVAIVAVLGLAYWAFIEAKEGGEGGAS